MNLISNDKNIHSYFTEAWGWVETSAFTDCQWIKQWANMKSEWRCSLPAMLYVMLLLGKSRHPRKSSIPPKGHLWNSPGAPNIPSLGFSLQPSPVSVLCRALPADLCKAWWAVLTSGFFPDPSWKAISIWFGACKSLSEPWELVMGGLACCSSWGRKESDTTERLNCTEYKFPCYSLHICPPPSPQP